MIKKIVQVPNLFDILNNLRKIVDEDTIILRRKLLINPLNQTECIEINLSLQGIVSTR